jgi:hypothetical protein
MFFPGSIPEDKRELWKVFPRVVFEQLGGGDMSADMQGMGKVWLADYQLTLTDRGKRGYERVHALKDAIIGSDADPGGLHCFNGTAGDVVVRGAMLQNLIDNTTLPDQAGSDTIQEINLDFRIIYER